MGRAYAPFGIYKELLEYGRSASLRAFVEFPTVREGPASKSAFTLQLILLSDPEEEKIVTGVPFSATAFSETKQTLANGVRTWSTCKLFRDSQGRIRREETTFASFGQSTSSVVISDPVAGKSLELDPDQQTAAQLANPSAGTKSDLKDRPQDKTDQEQKILARENLKTEDLGTQTIAGIAVQGRRTTMTIPAGQGGNEKSMPIVLETWYSNALHVVMMSKRNDPEARRDHVPSHQYSAYGTRSITLCCARWVYRA